MSIPINYWAVIVAGIVNMILGALWFGPFFGKAWMKESGMSSDADMKEAMKKGMPMGVNFLIQFIGSLLMAAVIAKVLIFTNAYLHTNGAWSGVMVALMVWIGFVLPTSLTVVLWNNKTWKFWAISYLYYLVGFILMGIILAVWM